MPKKIRWGIVGLGNIAGKFAADLKLLPDAELTEVASRDVNKAGEFARKFGAKKSSGSYEALFNSQDVDVVYIATPHSHHAENSIAALRAGKHVLCEKPLGLTLEEVRKMTRVAEEESRFLMEGMWSRFNPAVIEVLQRCRNGDLGKIRYIRADFAFNALGRNRDGRLFNPELGGGSMLDIGLYPVFLAYSLLGMPVGLDATALYLENGVEYQTAMRFTYHGAQALLFSSLACDTQMRAEIAGEEGSFLLEPRWHETDSYRHVSGGVNTLKEFELSGKGFTYEIQEVHRCLRKGHLQSALWSHKNSRDLVTLLDSISVVSRADQ